MRTTLKLENTKKTQHNVLNAYEMVLEIQVSCSVEVHLWKKKHQVGGSFLSISGSATVSGRHSERWSSIRIPRVYEPRDADVTDAGCILRVKSFNSFPGDSNRHPLPLFGSYLL